MACKNYAYKAVLLPLVGLNKWSTHQHVQNVNMMKGYLDRLRFRCLNCDQYLQGNLLVPLSSMRLCDCLQQMLRQTFHRLLEFGKVNFGVNTAG